MGKIADILGDHQININAAYATVEDKGTKEKMAYVHIFINHAQEKDMIKAIGVLVLYPYFVLQEVRSSNGNFM